MLQQQEHSRNSFCIPVAGAVWNPAAVHHHPVNKSGCHMACTRHGNLLLYQSRNSSNTAANVQQVSQHVSSTTQSRLCTLTWCRALL
jgi:hypothetical protein